MRQYETTSFIMQNECNVLKRYAHYLQNMKMMRVMAAAFVVMGLVFGVASFQHSVFASVVCIMMFGFAAAICVPVGSWSSKRVAANFYEDGNDTWTMTTWFEDDGIHRIDADGDEDAYPLSKLVCAYRSGDVLILCTGMQAAVPVNLAQLNETDRKSVFARINAESPKLKTIQEK